MCQTDLIRCLSAIYSLMRHVDRPTPRFFDALRYLPRWFIHQDSIIPVSYHHVENLSERRVCRTGGCTM